MKTDANGKATYKTTVPKGADLGQGSATVLVSTDRVRLDPGLHGHHHRQVAPARPARPAARSSVTAPAFAATIRGMPMWRCPHCGTPQAETARCWVCRRSSTACATCRHFRRSVAAQVGYCGLDRQRRPLKGDEIRACWEAAIAPVEVPATRALRRSCRARPTQPHDRTPVRRLEFVEVQSGLPARAGEPQGPTRRIAAPDVSTGTAAPTVEPHREPAVAIAATEPTWSLWGDLDA